MLTKDFDYYLPDHLIAQRPTTPRDHSKLLVLDKKTGSIINDHFYNISNYLKKGDLLILNNTRVMPARLYGKSFKTNSNVEILLLKQAKKNRWEILCKPGKKAKVGDKLIFNDKLSGEIV